MCAEGILPLAHSTAINRTPYPVLAQTVSANLSKVNSVMDKSLCRLVLANVKLAELVGFASCPPERVFLPTNPYGKVGTEPLPWLVFVFDVYAATVRMNPA